MNTRRTGARLLFVAAAACSAPPKPPPEPLPAPPPSVTAGPTPNTPRIVDKLENGITVVITENATGSNATLQFAFLSGTAFVAPGSCELATQVLLQAADASAGRPSLAQTIARLGGTVDARVGPLTTWLDFRVPGDRWQEALVALRRALASPTLSRNQIERIRTDFVANRTAWVRQDPLAAMAQVLLFGEASTAGYVTGLLDRDPAEISLFQARLWQPDRAVLTIEVPTAAASARAALAGNGAVGLGAWLPPPPLPGPVNLLERRFETGLYQVPARAGSPSDAPCRVGLVCSLPDLTLPTAAELLLLHACFTLGGSGGRLERLQQEAGLGHIMWRSDVVQTPDLRALLLTTEVQPTEVAMLWRTVQDAIASLRDVLPNSSELAIASRQVPLLARLGTGDDGARLRGATMLSLRGVELTTIDRLGAQLPQMPNFSLAFSAGVLQGLPLAMIVLGGAPLTDVPQLRLCETLPPGHAGEPTTGDLAQPNQAAAATMTWPERAADAIGDRDQLRRLVGWRYEARVSHELATGLVESATWRDDGSLQRSRTVLGQRVDTTLSGSNWSETVGATRSSLDEKQAAFERSEQRRHPLALLAAALRGDLHFRQVAQRDTGDRTVMVLEAIGDRFDRLRIHVDTGSHLVRAVEAWETLPDGTVLRVHDAWSDYRTIDGLRVPFRRLTTHDDGNNRVETVFTSWQPTLQLP